MVRTGTLLALICAAGVGTQALAVDLNRPVSPRRQLAVCMIKQMTASRTISYNAATVVCKAQLKAKAPTLASSLEGQPASGLAR